MDNKSFFQHYLNIAGYKYNEVLSKNNQLRYGKNGSLSINIRDGLWHCFKTGQGGNKYQLLTKLLNYSHTESKKILNQDSYKPEKKEIKTDYKKIDNKQKWKEIDKITENLIENSNNIKNYLNNRGIKDNFFINEALYYYNSSLVIPLVNNDNQFIGYQLKNLNKNISNRYKQYIIEEKERQFYYHMLNNVNSTPKNLGICEGIETGLSILQLEKTKQLSVICTLTSSNMRKLTISNINIKKLENITIYMDNDEAGKKAGNELKLYLNEKSKNYNFTVESKLPPEQGDFNDYLIKQSINNSTINKN